jgi:hypothetical protein
MLKHRLLVLVLLVLTTPILPAQAATKATLLEYIAQAKQGQLPEIKGFYHDMTEVYDIKRHTVVPKAYEIKYGLVNLICYEIIDADFFTGDWIYGGYIFTADENFPDDPERGTYRYFDFRAINKHQIIVGKYNSTSCDTYLVWERILPLKFGRQEHITYLPEKTASGNLRFWLLDEFLLERAD